MGCARSLCVLVTIVIVLMGACRGQVQTDKQGDALIYLSTYGYIRNGDVNTSADMARLVDGSKLKQAIMAFQNVAGLPQTGEADEKTLEMMHAPRCGMFDPDRKARRPKRFALLGAKWKKKILTYRIVSYSRQISRTATDYWVKEAFKVWTTVTPLQFYQIYNRKADIEIIFKGYNHGDPYRFDGKGGTLAHAFAPGEDIAGDAHFDDSESWIIRNPNLGGTDLFSVAVHEFGHVLGLSHYYTSGAVMSPFYNYIRDVNIVLNYDDINAIQSLYGGEQRRPRPRSGDKDVSSTQKPTTTLAPSTTPARPVPEYCRREVHFDAIVSTHSGKTYAFEGWQYVYIWNGFDLDPTTPKLTSNVFSQLHWGVDTAFSIKWHSREIIYIIKSWFVWMYDGGTLQIIAAQIPLSKMFPDLPIHLDAALRWWRDGNIYIFKGTQYWKMNQVRRDVFKVAPGYPWPTSKWNLPVHSVSAAMSWTANGNTYFFSEQNYYKYDDNARKVARGYPRPMAAWWLGCVKEPKNHKLGMKSETQQEVNMAVPMATMHSTLLILTTTVILSNFS